jgi:hypothetical protein
MPIVFVPAKKKKKKEKENAVIGLRLYLLICGNKHKADLQFHKSVFVKVVFLTRAVGK